MTYYIHIHIHTGLFTKNDAKTLTLLFLNKTELFNLCNILWIYTSHVAIKVLKTLRQSGTVELANKAFNTPTHGLRPPP